MDLPREPHGHEVGEVIEERGHPKHSKPRLYSALFLGGTNSQPTPSWAVLHRRPQPWLHRALYIDQE